MLHAISASLASPGTHGDPDAVVPHVTHDPDTGLAWPEPTVPEPDFVTLAGFLFEEASDTTDGCLTTIDGVCRHGHPSWLLRLGVV